MVGAIDVSDATSASTDLLTAVGTVGGLAVTIYVATKAFPFVMRWIGKFFSAGTGRAAG